MSFVIRRRAARVLCFDPAGRLLLIKATDPGDAHKPAWWELPGGGIDAGESAEDACRRELREEVGISTAAIGSCVWTQHARFTFAGWDFDQHERIHVATTEGLIDAPTHLEAFEALAFEGHRWWDVDDLLATTEPTVPPRLREFLPDVIALVREGRTIDEPVDVTPLEP